MKPGEYFDGPNARIAELEAEVEKLRGAVSAAEKSVNACRAFIHKCDTGQARSRRSYAEMTEAVAAYEAATAGDET